MNKLFLVLSMTIILSVIAFAQKSDVRQAEFYIGYSNNQVETGNGVTSSNTLNRSKRISLSGFEAAGVVRVHRFFGVKGDFSATYRSKDFNGATFTDNGATSGTLVSHTKQSLYNILGGIQIKDNNSETRFKPFAHVLFGVGYGREKYTCSSSSGVCANFNLATQTETGFAGAFGGGLDIKLNKRIGLRVIQIDYNPIHLDGQTFDNIRFGGGITF